MDKNTSEQEQKVETVKSPKMDKGQIKLSRIKRRFLKHVWLVRGGIILGVLAAFWVIYLLINSVFTNLGINNYLTLAKNFIFTPKEAIESIDGRTNILILGKGGQEHEAGDLTDTIIFASISNGDGISLISLPRDIWIAPLRAKVNSAYYWGNQKQENGGLVLAKSTVEEIVGQPVHYGLVVDFNEFVKVIDILGGIEVDVENSFTDEKYPIVGKETDTCNGDPELSCRYETITFEKGVQTMNGETALKFVRSRNAQGDEGTDFARAKRQQKVISALKEKMLSPKILFSPKTLSKLFKEGKDSVITDIPSEAGAIIARRLLQSRGNISSYVLDGEFLINPPKSVTYDNLYVFIPKSGDWEEVHEWVKGILPE